MRRFLQGLGIVLAVGLMGQARPEAQPALGGEMPSILLGLTSSEFAEREAAQGALAKIPAERVEQLQALAEAQTDAEVKSRLLARVTEMAVELVRRPGGIAGAAGIKSYPLPVRVVDGKGQGIAGALVSTPAFKFGPLLEGITGADGRVTLDVPVAGMPYQLRVDVNAFHVGIATVVQGAEGAAGRGEFVLEPLAILQDKITGTVVDAEGKPVAHHPLKLMGTYESDGLATTGERGEFSLMIRKDALRFALPLIKAGDLVAPLTLIRDATVPLHIRLVPGGTLTGKVTELETGRGIGGAVVTIHPKESIPRIRFEGRTEADGTYKMTGLPPGEYFVEVEDPAYFDPPPRGRPYERKTTLLSSALTSTANLAMRKAALMMGKVVDSDGKPVAGALMSLPSSVNGDYRGQNRGVQTGADGRFVIGTAHVGKSDLSLSVESPRDGRLATPLTALGEGELRIINVTLPGSVRVRGTIVDAAGKPIENVVGVIQYRNDTLQVLSKADGTFDFGPVTLVPGETQPEVRFHAPRPRRASLPPEKAGILRPNGQAGEIIILDHLSSTGHMGNNYFVEVPSREKAPPFYQHGSAALKATAKTGEVNLKVTLTPARLVEVTGIVKDSKGAAVANAEVYLLKWNATAEDWVKSVRQTKAGNIRIDSSSVGVADWRLAETRTDDQGRWRIFVVVDEVRPGIIANNVNIGFMKAGTYSKGSSAFVAQVLLPEETKEVEMTLAP